jgi:hypothetical protein
MVLMWLYDNIWIRTAGFKEICLHKLKASPEDEQKFDNEFLQGYINYQTLF